MFREISAPPGFHGDGRDTEDQKRLRDGRRRDVGFALGQYLQPAPMLFTRDGHNVYLGDMHRGQAAFLICAGPSLQTHDLSRLQQRGILTCAVNNAAAVVRPQLWVSVDDPGNFCDVIWRDPAITKFVPQGHMEKHFTILDERGALQPSREVVGDMPAVFGYRRNEAFVAEQWLYEDTFNWGNHSKRSDAYGNTGSRSVMYVALRLLFYLGVRQVYLLGCDFRMEQGKQNYAFPQDRSASSVRGNNDTYRVLNVRLSHLLPYFEKEGYRIFNCTPDSGLRVFPHVPYEEAIAAVTAAMPQTIQTAGMYDRAKREADAGKAAPKSPAKPAAPAAACGAAAPPPACADLLANLTLVVRVDRQSAEVWRHTWPTWAWFRPWLERLPLIVVHPDDLEMDAAELSWLGSRADVCHVTYEATAPLQRQMALLVKAPAAMVQTAWYLRLDPQAIAHAGGCGILPDWFEPDAQGRLPAWIASPWGYTKPAEAIARLDAWADEVPALRGCPRLDLPYDPRESRIRHATISSWCFFANTAWTRAIAEFTPDELPCPAHATYVQYCAQRRGDFVRRVPLKDYGWDHHFGSAEWTIQRCRQVLSTPAAPVAG